MDKTGLKEVKKVLDKKNLRINRMRTYYVGNEKEVIAKENILLGTLEDEERFKYIDIFKSILSGRFGKNLYNTEYTTEAETDHDMYPQHKLLMEMKSNMLNDDTYADKFAENIISDYENPGRYLIVIGSGVYDVPVKASDGTTLEDSEYVYQFLLVAICPVELAREGLCFDENTKQFSVYMKDWSVQKPVNGMLFPAFNDRQEDIHSALFYTKNANERHDEFAEKIMGVTLNKTEDEYKNIYQQLIEETFGHDCDYTTVSAVTDCLNTWAKDAENNNTEFVLDKHTLQRAMKYNNADEEAISRFETLFDEVMEDETYIPSDSVLDLKTTKIKSDDMQMNIKNESAEMFETRVIEGHEYLLVPITNNLTVNGVTIKEKLIKRD